jgi:hypothetical protein
MSDTSPRRRVMGNPAASTRAAASAYLYMDTTRVCAATRTARAVIDERSVALLST